MNKKELQAIAEAAAKNIKSEEDLNEFRSMLTKVTVEAALNAELDDHLGFDKHEQSESDNNRNGVTHKTLRTEDGPGHDHPRDRPNLQGNVRCRCLARTDFQSHGRHH